MLLMAFQTSEGPETHIITKLESNPNLREGGVYWPPPPNQGGSTGEGGSTVCLSPDPELQLWRSGLQISEETQIIIIYEHGY